MLGNSLYLLSLAVLCLISSARSEDLLEQYQTSQNQAHKWKGSHVIPTANLNTSGGSATSWLLARSRDSRSARPSRAESARRPRPFEERTRRERRESCPKDPPGTRVTPLWDRSRVLQWAFRKRF